MAVWPGGLAITKKGEINSGEINEPYTESGSIKRHLSGVGWRPIAPPDFTIYHIIPIFPEFREPDFAPGGHKTETCQFV